MAMSETLRQYFASRHIRYEMKWHPSSATSYQTALLAHVSPMQIAKPVILKNQFQHYVMAVVPAKSKLQVKIINEMLEHAFHLAKESELQASFRDCELGAIPPVGQAYHMDTIVDDKLLALDDVYLEGGDHEVLIHLHKEDFALLMEGLMHDQITQLEPYGRFYYH
ncbi:aminoacyl-tRNA deacylase [Spartinivicinus poritis]|uniref:YbaK/EbsC family protein n=1 Tax=Spartinivicinus poritis TaxID=2994640 RepID=A0ABT5U6M2_9GAMM|nr:YbaK/EbsC family protein [Spartinivicinus sp. A2-2]MDE1462007.1 YbaK/EbsC family protein [Spartinivicinus sp. A2-2]